MSQKPRDQKPHFFPGTKSFIEGGYTGDASLRPGEVAAVLSPPGALYHPCENPQFPEGVQVLERGEAVIPASTDPLKAQVGGDHYKSMKIQPVQFSMANRWDACAHSVLKYLTRHRAKNGVQDLQKAAHFAELRESQLLIHGMQKVAAAVSMRTFVRENGITGADASALLALEDWVALGSDRAKQALMLCIEMLIDEYSKK